VFQSVETIIVTWIATILLIIGWCLRFNPFSALHGFVVDLFRQRRLLVLFAGALSVLLLNKLELLIESHIQQKIDFTPYIYAFEGHVTPLFQQTLATRPLTYITTYFYVIVFAAMMVASLAIYHREKDFRSLYAFLYAISLNYFLAIPFFLFIPVEETWHMHPAIRFLIPDVYPAFEEQYRHFSGLDNSFPSLHTSISLMMAMIAYQSKNRRFARLTIVSAAVILFSILYLGIHWIMDLLAGVILGIFSASLAFRWSDYTLTYPWFFPTRKKPASEQSYH
jgi:membrane-associated phospholipid phosphatase